MIYGDHKQRKQIRLKNFDYSQSNAYFVTVCTYNRENLFGDIRIDDEVVGADSISARMVDDIFQQTIAQYGHVHCPQYVIMPNHFHAIIVIENPIVWADMESAPTRVSLSEIIQSFKRHTTIEYIKMVKQGILPPFDKRIWQRSFYDHIIRDEQDFYKISEYIENNPSKWEEDRFYVQGTVSK